MRRRTLIPTAGALTVSLVAGLVLASPMRVARTDFANVGYRALPVLPLAEPTLSGSTEGWAGTSDLPGLTAPAFGLTDSFNAGLARWRRRGSTVDRCGRTGRRPVTKTPGPRRVVSRDQVARGACHYFLRHATLDMDDLAVRLSISRATLYRVVHSRDRLLADVLWRLGENALRRIRTSGPPDGVEGVLEIGRRFAAVLQDAKPFRTFLTSEPDAAARVLLTATGGVHHRAVRAQKEILLDATPPGQVWPTGDLDSLAYLLVRIFESTFYADLLANRPPDRELAERAIRGVLESPPSRQS